MGNRIQTTAGSSVELTFNNVLGDGSISVTAYIYDGSTEVTTVALSHVANGYYRNSYTIPTGYSKLIAFYVPSGTDNSSDIDYIDIKLTSEGAGAFAGVTTGIDKMDINAITKSVVAEIMKRLEPILEKKSEFDPNEDIVKTNVDVTDQIQSIIPTINKIIVSNKPVIPDYSRQLSRINEKIEVLPEKIIIPDNSFVLTRMTDIESALLNAIREIPRAEIPDYSESFAGVNSRISDLELGLQSVNVSGPITLHIMGDSDIIMHKDSGKKVDSAMENMRSVMVSEMKKLSDSINTIPEKNNERVALLNKAINRMEASVKEEMAKQINTLDQVEVKRTDFIVKKIMTIITKALNEIAKSRDVDDMRAGIDLLIDKIINNAV